MKKIIFSLFIIFTVINSSYAAGSSSESKTASNYDKAVKLIKAAKKYEQKGKIDKAKKIDSGGNYQVGKLPDWAPLEKVDLVLSMEFIYYLEDPFEFIKSTHDDWLLDGGTIAIGMDHYLENESSLSWSDSMNLKLATRSIQDWLFEFKKAEDYYLLKAKFMKVGGVMIGNDVKLSGVKVGVVSDVRLDEDYFAEVVFKIYSDIMIPKEISIVGDIKATV